MNRFTLTLPAGMKELLEQRAHHNRRSISGEAIYLMEVALAAELETDTGFMRSLYLIQPGSQPGHARTGAAAS